ncbi:MAG TPA: GNAT family N-acetyltransferase [Gemmatimonadales bacterium]|nr:GNAT family N-acetyltransferase [Gemmatimonadales bacterium]
MSSVLFSAYQPGDRTACLQLFDANSPAYFAPNERDEYAAFLETAPGMYELCRRGDRIVGAFGVQPAGASDAHLRWILLAPDAQGQGIGTAIMRRVAELARAQGRPLVRIAASQKSAPFFTRFGASITTSTRDGWGPGMDRIDLEWRP